MNARRRETAEQGSDRRRNVRGLTVAEPVTCQLMGLDEPVEVNEVGTGGFSITAPQPLKTGSAQVFKFTFGDGSSAMVSAEARHTTCLLLRRSQGFVYRTGFAFSGLEDPQVNQSVNLLIDRLLSAFSVK